MTVPCVDEIERTLAAYDAGLARQLVDLERFHDLALRQGEAACSGDVEALSAITHHRDVAMRQLLDSAAELSPLRQLVESLGNEWAEHPHLGSALDARRRVGDWIGRILAQDAVTRASLETAYERRQHDRQELEAANATLAAYRRSLGPTSRPATLVDHRG